MVMDKFAYGEFVSSESRADCSPEANDEFAKSLLADVSGVLFADKAGELLTYGYGDSRLDIEQCIERTEKLSRGWGLSSLVLKRGQDRVNIIIYRPEAVRDCLSRIPRRFMSRLGYPGDIGPVRFLEEVGRRWQERNSIPHEIGFALGYPAKDVLGYMGLIPLKHTGQQGWQIYGDPGPSLRRCRRYEHAREMAMALSGA
jgi:hypothetical protein